MKYLLVRPRYKNVLANLEPLGLEYVAGVLNMLEKQYEIYDEFIYSSCFKKTRFKSILKKYRPDVVGFTAHINTVDIICEMANRIKQINPNCIVIIGGPHAELNCDEFFTNSIDYIFTSSGLESFSKAVECDFDKTQTNSLNGVCYMGSNSWIINEKGLPTEHFLTKPDRSFFYSNNKKSYLVGKGNYALLKASFSCPFDCKFCYCCKMNSGVYKEIDLDSVIEEINDIKHDKIWIVDDTFLANRKRVIDFIDKIHAGSINKRFLAYSRTDFIVDNKDLLHKLFDAGVKELLVGIEACEASFLKEYNKKTDYDINVEAIKLLRENKIICNGLFIVDHRFTKADFKNMYNFIKATNLYWAVFAIFTPLKHTDIYDEYKDMLINYVPKRLDFTHLVLKPLHMSSFMFYVRFYKLNLKVYIRLLIAYIFGKEGARFE